MVLSRPTLSSLVLSLLVLLIPLQSIAQTRIGKNICLVITYTTPFYATMASLKARYAGLFANIVFYGPTDYPGVNRADINNGTTSYVAIADAMQRYPNYNGYLMIYNYRYLASSSFQNAFDEEKIWLDNYNLINQQPDALTASPWWQSTNGLQAVQKVMSGLSSEQASLLTANCGQRVPVSAASMIYLPAHIKDQVKQISDACYQNRLHSAVAYPLIALCIDKKDNMQLFGSSVPWR